MKKHNFKKLTREIIEKDFPKLNANRVLVIPVKRKDFFMATLKLPFKLGFLLLVDKEVFKMKRKAITGCLVHELIHLANWGKIDGEREIDQLVINMGYGEHLLEFLKYHDKKYQKYTKEDGLTRKEVIKQLKAMKPNQ